MVSTLVSEGQWASALGTARFKERHAPGKAEDFYSEQGGLHVSSLGLGTYLGEATDATDAAYEEAIVEAVRLGVNVIDTASSYRCGRSERAVGRAIKRLLADGECFRSEVIVASKAGFLPYEDGPPEDPSAWLHERYVDTGLCRAEEIVSGCHCISPAFIDAMIARSHGRLDLSCIDAYFLHNPEAQFRDVTRTTFNRRLRAAVGALERAVEDGRIRVWGISTWNSLRAHPSDREYLSLGDVMTAAQDVAGSRHHFKVVQLPYSLAMPEAWSERNQLVGAANTHALHAAQELGLMAWVSAPLYQRKLTWNLASNIRDAFPSLDTDAQRALQFARSTPGVATALVGMKATAHVESNLALAQRPKATSREIEALFRPG